MLDIQEEKRIAELKDLCRILKVPPPPDVLISLKVHDGGVLVFDDIQRGHSWTRNYYNLMLGYSTGAYSSANGSTFGTGYIAGKDMVGNASEYQGRTTFGNTYVIGGNYADQYAGADYGILVGSGDAAFNKEDYALASLILHGNLADRLFYQAMTAPVATYTAGSKTWTTNISRIFNNNSGGSITVKETGIAYGGIIFGNGGAFLIERSLLSPSVTVANAAQLTVTYSISMDFSAID